ncbi:hypothetical protein SLS60_007106 [Paraconiothyrium brasiliense]|uniref:Heterokaryon incompatibility domain-containing protein n=1 Tax=Paraconiothyrium brasiliense TaxID=300254 RepID=A0ABR3R926_9PLEO
MSQYLGSDEGNTVIDGRENEASSSTSFGQASRKVDTFVHTPLLRHQDNTPIRLLQICNGSTEDDIRLAIHHTHDWTKGESHRTTYTCLSYRCGGDQATRRISVDGKAKYVRENLYDFLATWTRKDQDAKKRLWIDALCIDQSNVAERNHQVQKMGEIYKTADEVIIWLGRYPAIDQNLRAVFSIREQPVPSDIESLLRIFDPDQAFHVAEEVLRIILWNDYWNRAWITQEVYLARKKTLAMNDQTIPLETFFQRLDDYCIFAGKAYHQYSACMEMKVEMSKPRASSLVCLLSHFRNKLCSVPRDRIFSLLSICADGDQFEVDYELPKEELMYKVLRNSSEILCFCTAATVAQNLNIDDPSQPTDVQPGFQGYLLKDLLVRDLKWKRQRALYMANDHIEYGNK